MRRAMERGHDVLCLIPVGTVNDDPAWEKKLAGLGVRLAHYRLDRKGLNPLRDLATLSDLRRIFKREKPDVLFACAIKPVIYGAFASALAGFPRKSRRSFMITGLGYMFEADSPVKCLLMQLARLLYRCAFTVAGRVFFQNGDDRALFEKLGILPSSLDVLMCKGTGVDTGRFALRPPYAGPPVFLFVGRLIAAKGLREFMGAARMTRVTHPEALFRVIGPAEPGPGGVPLEEVLAARDAGDIEYLGEQPDVRPWLEQARAVVLPSYREGVPVSLMEASAVGRAVIAADAPGSREVVVDGLTGFLVQPKNVHALAEAVQRLITDPALAERMGLQGRGFMEKEYDACAVADCLLDAIGALG
ncbi:MAG: glycosyltransferase family 4 protein [Desulfovibrio sp.]|nr:glycosyltransferase family 4 protein [Desulfovibrio sp.]